ncbi:SIMPL domain-containing protein [Sphingomonas bacterium]|uniref:SIMPL domain-containing protein n=1 Tax=Sphingomonas bacterium TaxID=1895847 RepID=UPI001576A618|nr:SIMPL domain-containing protein [Sphingomonas bacterium]
MRAVHPVTAITAAALFATPVFAGPDDSPHISVAATASVQTPPDRATIEYAVRGEGATSDMAIAALVATRQRIEDTVAILAQPISIHTGKVTIQEVRDSRCKSDDDSPHLASGACSIVGYTALITATIDTGAVAQVGTMVGLLGRGGAINPRVEDFALSRPHDAERKALAAALANARRKAEAVAEGSGVRLGRLLSVSTDPDRSDAQDIVVTASRRSASPGIAGAPIIVELTPSPVETRARVSVVYAITP